MKISKKYNMLVFAVFMAMTMTFMTSLAMSIVSFGSGFLGKWPLAFSVSFLVAVPTLLIAFPFMRQLADSIAYE